MYLYLGCEGFHLFKDLVSVSNSTLVFHNGFCVPVLDVGVKYYSEMFGVTPRDVVKVDSDIRGICVGVSGPGRKT